MSVQEIIGKAPEHLKNIILRVVLLREFSQSGFNNTRAIQHTIGHLGLEDQSRVMATVALIEREEKSGGAK